MRNRKLIIIHLIIFSFSIFGFFSSNKDALAQNTDPCQSTNQTFCYKWDYGCYTGIEDATCSYSQYYSIIHDDAQSARNDANCACNRCVSWNESQADDVDYTCQEVGCEQFTGGVHDGRWRCQYEMTWTSVDTCAPNKEYVDSNCSDCCASEPGTVCSGPNGNGKFRCIPDCSLTTYPSLPICYPCCQGAGEICEPDGTDFQCMQCDENSVWSSEARCNQCCEDILQGSCESSGSNWTCNVDIEADCDFAWLAGSPLCYGCCEEDDCEEVGNYSISDIQDIAFIPPSPSDPITVYQCNTISSCNNPHDNFDIGYCGDDPECDMDSWCISDFAGSAGGTCLYNTLCEIVFQGCDPANRSFSTDICGASGDCAEDEWCSLVAVGYSGVCRPCLNEGDRAPNIFNVQALLELFREQDPEALAELFSIFYRIVAPIIIVLGMIMVIISGYGIMTSTDDPRKKSDSKQRLSAALMGLAVALFGAGFLRLLINTILGSGIAF